MAGGRPPKYGPKILEKMRKYIDDCTIAGDVFPSIAGCSLYCGTHRDTFHAWKRDEDKPEFSYMYDELLTTQEQYCLRGGISNEYNSTIAKLVLAKHGYSDRVDQNTTLEGGDKPVKVQQVEFKVVDPEKKGRK